MSWVGWVLLVGAATVLGVWVGDLLFRRQHKKEQAAWEASILPTIPFPFSECPDVQMFTVGSGHPANPKKCTHDRVVALSIGLPSQMLCVDCLECEELPLTWCSLVKLNTKTGDKLFDVFMVDNPTKRCRVLDTGSFVSTYTGTGGWMRVTGSYVYHGPAPKP